MMKQFRLASIDPAQPGQGIDGRTIIAQDLNLFAGLRKIEIKVQSIFCSRRGDRAQLVM